MASRILWSGTENIIISMKDKIAVIGLGYVGLPLAHAFSSKFEVIGFDIRVDRINSLNDLNDETKELDENQLREAKSNGILFTSSVSELSDCNIYIVTVPTPIDKNNKPNLDPLISASKMVGKILNKKDIVIFESTVYPGATEEECVPILQKESGLKFNQDFFCGYSPERINPGDKEHTVTKIKKVTSGSNRDTAKKVDWLYSQVITAGTFLTSSIKVAEAAKVIENSQRDLNIAFVNELAILFQKLNIDTTEVLNAAMTKWNFLDFKPGLVGGHCIGVDPYYLTHKAQKIGYLPEVILAGRRINDSMPEHIAGRVVKLMIRKKINVKDSKVLILGITFKENCPDIRNSKVYDLYNELNEFGCLVSVTDYVANKDEVKQEYGIDLQSNPNYDDFNAIVLAVKHNEYIGLRFSKKQVVYDVKSCLSNFDERL